MRVMIAIALLLIVGQASADQPQALIDVQHDSRHQVTCWITPQGGISCLPDSSLPQKATPSSETGRASPTKSAYRTGSLQAAPLPQVEGFQL
ncbi:hypothetical protein C7534_12255 [Pseudomonas sp. OV226]|nr:hypothetical protein C7534_12255 [Pseudomonas sp. OV226]